MANLTVLYNALDSVDEEIDQFGDILLTKSNHTDADAREALRLLKHRHSIRCKIRCKIRKTHEESEG